MVDAALLVSGAVVTESVFAWPGLGSLFTEALARRDYSRADGAADAHVDGDRRVQRRRRCRARAARPARRGGVMRAPALLLVCLVAAALAAPALAPYPPDQLDLAASPRSAVVGALVRHRRSRTRCARARPVRRAGVARGRSAVGGGRGRVGHRHRRHRRICRRRDRRGADARHRCHAGRAAAAAADDCGQRPAAVGAAAGRADRPGGLDGDGARRARRIPDASRRAASSKARARGRRRPRRG